MQIFPVKNCLRDHLPLQQGLRLGVEVAVLCVATHVRDHLPLKQGLRLINNAAKEIETPLIRDHLPLKQGLRLSGVHLALERSETIFH